MAEVSLEESICRMKWSTYVLTGIMSIAFGIMFFAFPKLTAEVVVTLLGIVILVLAIFAVVIALASRVGDPHSGLLLVLGIAGFFSGMAAIMSPLVFGAVLSTILGVVLLAIGVVNIAMGFSEREGRGRWCLFLLGIVSIAFAVLLVAYPLYGSLILFGYMVGVYFVLYGILLVGAGFIVRRIAPEICPVE
ncbi:MAG: DUF308 domain-containing protein [Methanolinea sp.]|nr:DUF308 domain-containing protein [Methanolinea sp.]